MAEDAVAAGHCSAAVAVAARVPLFLLVAGRE